MPLLHILNLKMMKNLNYHFLEIAILHYLEMAIFQMKVVYRYLFLMTWSPKTVYFLNKMLERMLIWRRKLPIVEMMMKVIVPN